MQKLTRQAIARAFVTQYSGAQSTGQRKKVLASLAAIVIEEKLHNQIDVLLRDIIQEQTRQNGTLATELTSRFELNNKVLDELASQLKKLTGANKIIFESHVNEQLLGGVRMQTPTAELDISLSRRLQDFRRIASAS